MFYNPHTLVCDWPGNVILVRPECSYTQTTSVEVEEKKNITSTGPAHLLYNFYRS